MLVLISAGFTNMNTSEMSQIYSNSPLYQKHTQFPQEVLKEIAVHEIQKQNFMR